MKTSRSDTDMFAEEQSAIVVWVVVRVQSTEYRDGR